MDGFKYLCKPCFAGDLSRAREQYTQRYHDLKEASPCTDCGGYFPFYVMQYDHRPGEVKIRGVAEITRGFGSWARALAEIAKCDLVCANCHARRTWFRTQAEEAS